MSDRPQVFSDEALLGALTAEQRLVTFLFEFARMGDQVAVATQQSEDPETVPGLALTLHGGPGRGSWELKLTPVLRGGKPVIAVALRPYSRATDRP